MNRLATAAACAAVALLTFVQFPGHTWLQQDSQIYVAIIEHQCDPLALRNDIVATHPHVAFTLYDEVSRALAPAAAGNLQVVLEGQQLMTRALGVLGLLLIALALGLGEAFAWLIALTASLGATIVGPSVLTIEYEPTPRAFAVPLLICAMGLVGHRRFGWASLATAAAILYHAPTTWPILVILVPLFAMRKQWSGLAVLGAAVILLLAVGAGQGGQPVFVRLGSLDIQLQRMRTAYVWISQWQAAWIWHWCLVAGLAWAAWWRVRGKMPVEVRAFAVGLPLIALLSMPLSWALLEQAHWALVPEVQPLRALLWAALLMQLLSAAAAVYAGAKRHWAECAGWFSVAFALPAQQVLTEGWQWRHAAAIAAVALLASAMLRWAPRFAPAAGLAAFFTLPWISGVLNYPKLHTPELAALSEWARSHTARDAVFAFPDAAHLVYPGIFRAEAERAVYVDWKGGGQVNFSHEFAEEWWLRWQLQQKPGTLGAMGMNYVVVRKGGGQAEYQNTEYRVYRVR